MILLRPDISVSAPTLSHDCLHKFAARAIVFMFTRFHVRALMGLPKRGCSAVFVLWAVFLSAAVCQSGSDVVTDSPCSSKCDCSGFPIVSCANAGLETMPDDLPENTTQLFMQGNNISDSSGLRRSLERLGQLVYLELDNNFLTAIEPSTFQNNPHLKYLYLRNNLISTIESPVTLFKGLIIVQLAGNPLHCDCLLRDLYLWLISTTTTVDKDSVECNWPVTGVRLTDFSLSALICDVDECATIQRGGCDQQCVNTHGSYRCQCNPGYQLNNDGKTCSDTNECENSRTSGCTNGCLNLEGSYVCLCPEGQVLTADRKSCTVADPAFCPPNAVVNSKGSFYWRQASPGSTVDLDCPHGSIESSINDFAQAKASRQCMRIEGRGEWKNPDTSQCQYASQLTRELKAYSDSVTAANRESVAIYVQQKAEDNVRTLSADDLNLATRALERTVAVDLGSIPNKIGQIVVETVSVLISTSKTALTKAQESFLTSSRLIRVLERFGDSVVFPIGSVSFSALTEQIGIRAVDYNQADYRGATFLSLRTENDDVEVHYRSGISPLLNDERDKLLSSIYLPLALLSEIRVTVSPVRVQFSVFHNGTLFVPFGATADKHVERAVGARVTALSGVTNLENEIEVIIRHRTKQSDESVICVHWDPASNGGFGDWDTSGCQLDEASSTADLSVCRCNHLTDFSVILRPQCLNASTCERELTLEVYIGCGVSLAFLCTTFVLINLIRKQKTSVSMKIQVNFVFSCVVSLVAFMAGIYRTTPSGVCQAVAAVVHFGFLASLMWLLTEAFTLYSDHFRARVSWNTSIVKRWLLAWAVPLATVVALVVVTNVTDTEIYGGKQYCWIVNEYAMIGGFYAPPALVLLLNVVLYIATHRRMARNPSRLAVLRLRLAAVDLFLFLLAWASASLTVRGLLDNHKAFEILFIVFVVVFGVAVFSLQCMVNTEVRRKLRTVLCGARARRYARTDERSGKTSRTSLDVYDYYYPHQRDVPVGSSVNELDAFYDGPRRTYYNPLHEPYRSRKDIGMDSRGRVLYRPAPVGRERYFGEGEEPDVGEDYVRDEGIELWWSPSTTGLDRDDDEFLFRGKKGNGVEWNEDGDGEEAGGDRGFVNFM